MFQFSSVAQSFPILCDPMNHSTPGLPVHHQLPEFTQTHVHQIGDAIQPSHPLSSPSPPAPNPSQRQSLFQWVNSSQEVAKVYMYLYIFCIHVSIHILKSRDIIFPREIRLVKAMFFFSSYVWMWELDYKESLAPKNWCFWTVVLEKTLESLLDCKEIQPVHPKGNQSWIFFGRTDAEAETPILWPPDVKNWLIWEDPDAGKDWRQEEKGTTEDKMVGWHHQLNGHEFE